MEDFVAAAIVLFILGIGVYFGTQLEQETIIEHYKHYDKIELDAQFYTCPTLIEK